MYTYYSIELAIEGFFWDIIFNISTHDPTLLAGHYAPIPVQFCDGAIITRWGLATNATDMYNPLCRPF